MNVKFYLLLVSLLTGFALVSRAGNPLVPGIGLTDPHGVVYGDRVYLYATHDASPDSQGFKMTNWWVCSSADLVNWKQAGTLEPEATYLGQAFNSCRATFGVTRNGKYYWYFSAGPKSIGVVVADAPNGPWHDPLVKPLVPEGLVPTEERDPDILMDDDGNAYMVFGTFNYYLVRLNDDMISLAEKPRLLQVNQKAGPYGKGQTDDKPSLHKRNGIYYLSWSSYYATADNPYGPYTFKGTVIDSKNVAADFQTSEKMLHHDRHGNFFTFHHQWYYVFNDKSQPGRNEHFRDCCLAYVHCRANGDIAPIRLDRVGVGEYDGAQPRIEAEDYFDVSGAEPAEMATGGFEMRGFKEGSYLVYPKVMNLRQNSPFTLRVASAAAGSIIEFREHDAHGTLLGRCEVPETANQYQTITGSLRNASGTKNIRLVFKSKNAAALRLDWLSFANLNKP